MQVRIPQRESILTRLQVRFDDKCKPAQYLGMDFLIDYFQSQQIETRYNTGIPNGTLDALVFTYLCDNQLVIRLVGLKIKLLLASRQEESNKIKIEVKWQYIY